MSYTYIPTRFQWRQDTAANWTANNPIPLQGEPCLENDTAWPKSGLPKFKIGDGITRWNSLGYAVGDFPVAGDVTITDAGNYFTSPDIEGALQELGAEVANFSADLKNIARLYDECDKPSATTAGWVSDISGGSLAVQQTVAGMVGAYGVNSGAASSSRCGLTAPGFKVTPGSGEIRAFFRVQPQHLPAGSQQSWYDFGLFDSTTTTSANAIRIGARDSYATGNWYLNYVHPVGGIVVSTTAITLTPGAINDLELVIAAAGGSVSAYLNGTLADTIALPASFAAMHPGILSRKSGATGASSTLYVDKVLVEQDQ